MQGTPLGFPPPPPYRSPGEQMDAQMGAEPRGSARPRLRTSLLQPRSRLRPGLLARTACMASELDLVPVCMIFMPAEAHPVNTQLIRNVCVFEAAPSEPFQHHVNHGRAPGKRLHRQTVQGRRASSEVGDWWTERAGPFRSAG